MDGKISLDKPDYSQNQISTIQNKKSGNGWLNSIGGIIAIIIIIQMITEASMGGGIFGSLFESSYYVAKLPSFDAATVKVDGYMHKSKSCCEKVADYYGAEVIRVKPSQKAGTNSYGQTLKYKDCFHYCPLCRY